MANALRLVHRVRERRRDAVELVVAPGAAVGTDPAVLRPPDRCCREGGQRVLATAGAVREEGGERRARFVVGRLGRAERALAEIEPRLAPPICQYRHLL